MTTESIENARESFFVIFASRTEAVAYETSALSIGREFLPPVALAVLDGGDASAEYWGWLADSAIEQIAEREINALDWADTSPAAPSL